MVPPLVGRRQSLGGVTAKVKRLEQDRDAGGRHIDRADHARTAYLAEWILRKERLRAVWRIPCAATSAGSRELVRVRCQVPVPAALVRVRTSSCAFTTGHSFAHSSGRLTLAEHKSPCSEGAPGRVRTCDPPLRRCPHRVRTRSSVSSQTPRPGLSPCQEPIGSGQTAHNHRALHRPGCLRQGLWLPHIPCRLGVELRTTRRAVIATLTEYLPAREQAVPVPPTALAEATAEILRRLQAIEDRLAG